MKSRCSTEQRAAISAFLKATTAKPGKRYPVFVWKIPSIFPADIYKMFVCWKERSDYQNVTLFKNKAVFLEWLFKEFDSLGLNWKRKTSYGREKIYFGNLRLKQYGCKLLMKIEAKTFLGR